jgi:hypothetical protein
MLFSWAKEWVTTLARIWTHYRQRTLSWTSRILSRFSHPTSLRSVATLFFFLVIGLPSGSFFHVFPLRFYIYIIRATCPTHLALLQLVVVIIFAEEYNQWQLTTYKHMYRATSGPVSLLLPVMDTQVWAHVFLKYFSQRWSLSSQVVLYYDC